ncbi:MAG: hypothetical protein ABR992_08170 [Solirubrobacteraceae bacterium]|jgi:hypothetical protein
MGAVITMLIAALAIVIDGKESSDTATVSAPMPSHTTKARAASASTETADTAAATSSYPVVNFTYEKVWPLTAQLVNITENLYGFPGGGLVPPPHYTILMVQVDITSKIVGRAIPSPVFKLVCSEPGVKFGASGLYGYDGGPDAAPDPSGSYIDLGDGQPHAWDSEWEVPEGTSTAGVICQLEEATDYSPMIQALN